MSLVARHLEANGIPTVILGSALDIAGHCGVPRFLFTDMPLGNPCGVPYDCVMQRAIVESSLDLFEQAPGPRSIVHTPYRFTENENWRASFLAVRDDNRAELAASGAARRSLLAQQKSTRIAPSKGHSSDGSIH